MSVGVNWSAFFIRWFCFFNNNKKFFVSCLHTQFIHKYLSNNFSGYFRRYISFLVAPKYMRNWRRLLIISFATANKIFTILVNSIQTEKHFLSRDKCKHNIHCHCSQFNKHFSHWEDIVPHLQTHLMLLINLSFDPHFSTVFYLSFLKAMIVITFEYNRNTRTLKTVASEQINSLNYSALIVYSFVINNH